MFFDRGRCGIFVKLTSKMSTNLINKMLSKKSWLNTKILIPILIDAHIDEFRGKVC
jgi:hypothetical protein